MRSLAAASVPPTVKGRYRSGQTGQTVNLLALRLRWFESSPAQIFTAGKSAETADVQHFLPAYAVTCLSGLFAGHRHVDHHIHRRRHRTRVRHHRAVVLRVAALHSPSMADLRWLGH